MLSAVQHLLAHGLAHNDIKPGKGHACCGIAMTTAAHGVGVYQSVRERKVHVGIYSAYKDGSPTDMNTQWVLTLPNRVIAVCFVSVDTW